MKAIRRRWFLTTLLLAGGVSAGCGDLGSTLYFLMPEQMVPAEIKCLGTTEKKQTPSKAMILVRNMSNVGNYKFRDADRVLSGFVHHELTELCEHNEQRLTLIDPRKVDAFKSSHPRWRELSPAQIGKQFGTDYVIYLEINDLGMTSAEGIYRGTAELSVRLIDVKAPDESPPTKNFACAYPSPSNFIVTDSMPEQNFRDKFLTFVAKRLAWYFEPHPERDTYNAAD
jgi:hypothetical protein